MTDADAGHEPPAEPPRRRRRGGRRGVPEIADGGTWASGADLLRAGVDEDTPPYGTPGGERAGAVDEDTPPYGFPAGGAPAAYGDGFPAGGDGYPAGDDKFPADGDGFPTRGDRFPADDGSPAGDAAPEADDAWFAPVAAPATGGDGTTPRRQPPPFPRLPSTPRLPSSPRSRATLALAGIVVLALVGLLVWRPWTGSDTTRDRTPAAGTHPGAARKPPGPDLERVWSLPRATTPQRPLSKPKLWHTHSTLVTATTNQITGHSDEDGAPRWSVRPPHGTTSVCYMSSGVNSHGIGAVAFRKAGGKAFEPCSVVGAIDARQGKLRWAKDLDRPAYKERDNRKAQTNVMSLIPGEHVLTASLVRGFVRFAPATGKRLPAGDLHVPEGCEARTVTAQRRDIVVDLSCGGDPQHNRIMVFDPDSGKRRWTAHSGGTLVAGVVAHRPLTLQITAYRGHNEGDVQAGYLQTYSDDGRQQNRVPLPITGGAPQVAGVSVGGGVLVAQITGSTRKESGSVFGALDLKTGRWLWRKEERPDQLPQLLGSAGDGTVLARQQETESLWSRLLVYEAKDGERDVVGTLPQDAAYACCYRWDDRTLYFAARGGLAAPLAAYRRD